MACIDVKILPVSECLKELGCDEIDLCKCDIEGGEAALFAECSDWIGCVKTLVVETHEPYTLDRLVSDLGRNGSPLRLKSHSSRGGCSLAFFA